MFKTYSLVIYQPVDNDLEGGNTSKGRSSLAAEFLQLLLVADVAAAAAVAAVAVADVGVVAVAVAVAAETSNAMNIFVYDHRHTC